MNRKQLVFLPPVFLFLLASSHAQTALVCNDFITVSLGPDCARAIAPDEILEGTYQIPIDDFIVELDKTAPFGNGPWVPALSCSTFSVTTYLSC